MSFLKKAIVGLSVLVVVTLLGGLVLPSQVHVERQALIDAPANKVFAEVSDFNNWQAWSPWANIDPESTLTITGKGVGQTMTWASDNPEVGNGTQTVTALDSPRRVTNHLDFGDMGESDTAFVLEPTDDGTLVTWSLDTDVRKGVPLLNQPMSTYFGFLMDSMIGDKYEEGLANLKAVVEG
ncbi:MAG: SRPBCC family protein [Cyanobacteria bacterium J06648_10]